MSYTVGKPIHPEKKSRKSVAIFAIILFPFLSYLLYLNFIADREPITQKALLSGYHFVDKYPFVIKVDYNETGYLTEHQWTYDITYSPAIVIYPGHVGVIITKSNREINPETLKPGIYNLNLDLYEVRHVDIRPKEYIFGPNQKEDRILH